MIAPVQLLLPTFADGDPTDEDREFFETPLAVCQYAVECLIPALGRRPSVLVPGAGSGRWGRAILERFPHARLAGVDLPGVEPVPFYLDWHAADYRTLALHWLQTDQPRYDVIVGNPPFSKAEDFVRASYALLKPGGLLIQYLRISFRAGTKRGRGLWRERPLRVEVPSSRRPSFTGDGITDPKTDYALYVWQAGWRGRTVSHTPFDYDNRSTWDVFDYDDLML